MSSCDSPSDRESNCLGPWAIALPSCSPQIFPLFLTWYGCNAFKHSICFTSFPIQRPVLTWAQSSAPKRNLPTCTKEAFLPSFIYSLFLLRMFQVTLITHILGGEPQVPPTCTQMQFLEKKHILIFHFCQVSSNSIIAVSPCCWVCSEDFSQFTFCSGWHRSHLQLQSLFFLNVYSSVG